MKKKKGKCVDCGYDWESRVDKPKRCPRCKTVLDKPKRKTVTLQRLSKF